jgi:hypothetical protein
MTTQKPAGNVFSSDAAQRHREIASAHVEELRRPDQIQKDSQRLILDAANIGVLPGDVGK